MDRVFFLSIYTDNSFVLHSVNNTVLRTNSFGRYVSYFDCFLLNQKRFWEIICATLAVFRFIKKKIYLKLVMTRTQLGIKMNGKKSSAPRHQGDPNAPVKIIHGPLSYFDKNVWYWTLYMFRGRSMYTRKK